ncbi:MAG: DUF3320 domain-containing protein, partial [Planctomycetota bacterium]
RQQPEIEDFFRPNRKEHFFVKNLETIQGDERDVIFISVGFGFNEAKKFSLNFGPLNQSGGERRLNVLISRAREKCVVFSNFRASDLLLEATAPTGLKALKIFLEYAETGKLLNTRPVKTETNSAFEDAILQFLKKQGYLVEQKIGCGEFRMDFAILDPQTPEHYLLGIECDGPKYHSCLVTRDRDRLRPQILESLGWKLHRIWSPDWYCKRTETEHHLLEAIRQAKLEGTQNLLLHRNDFYSIENASIETARPKMLENKDTKEIKILGLKELAQLSFPPPSELEESSATIVSSKSADSLTLNESDILFAPDNSAEKQRLLSEKSVALPAQQSEELSNETDAVSAPTKELKNLFPSAKEEQSESQEEEPIEETYYEEDTTSSSISYYDEDGFPAPFSYSTLAKNKESHSSKTKQKNPIVANEENTIQESSSNDKKDFGDNLKPPIPTVAPSEIEFPPSQLETLIPLYEVCQSVGIIAEGKLQEIPQEQLILAVCQVVNIEGPIHQEEVLRRLRSLFGIKRSTSKIQEILGRALFMAEQSQKIRRIEEFWWPLQNRVSLLRRRTNEEMPPKIEMICEEEIIEAIQWVLKHQFASPM